jgi:hypothetical protein
MGLFIRKSFSAGPIRFNLSKSGIGISAGVKGARVGIGPRGSYVAGGRHGLYFRERLGSNKANISEIDQTPYPIEERVDTGVTYPSNIRFTSVKIEDKPHLPILVQKPSYAFAAFLISSVLMFSIESEGLKVLFILIALITLSYSLLKHLIHTSIKNKRAIIVNALKEYERALDSGENLTPFIIREDVKKSGKNYYHYYRWHTLESYLHFQLEKGQEIDEGFIEQAIKQMAFPAQYANALKIHVFRTVFKLFMEDEHLEDNEENTLKELALKLRLDDDDIAEELQSINYMSELRKDTERGLIPVNTDFKLQKSEKCYLASEGKLLKEKVLSSRSINRVKHKTIGFVEDRIGDVILTNKRLLVIGGGTRTIKLNAIIDVILDFENNIVELIVDGKQKPCYITSPYAPNLAVKMQQIIQTESEA